MMKTKSFIIGFFLLLVMVTSLYFTLASCFNVAEDYIQESQEFTDQSLDVSQNDQLQGEKSNIQSYPSDWTLGESVKVDFVYANSFMMPETVDYLLPDEMVDWFIQDMIIGDLYKLEFTGGTGFNPSTKETIVITMSMKAVSSGTLYYDLDALLWNSTRTGYNHHTLNSNTYAVTDEYMDRDGRINLYFYISFDRNELYWYAGIWNSASRAWYFMINANADPDVADITNIGSDCSIIIDNLYFIPSSDSNHYRSDYRYISEITIDHRIIIKNPSWNTDFHVYAPESWEMQIMQDCYYEYDSSNGYWLVNETIGGIDYELMFLSGAEITGSDSITRQAQYLAIEDKSNDYLSNVGFENGWQDDFTNNPAYDYESVELNTTIVSEGAFSLRLEDTVASGYSQLEFLLADGYYYISFSYYVESNPTGSLRFYTYDAIAAAWSAVILSTTGRWVNVFQYAHITGYDTQGTTDTNVQFNCYTGTGVIFIDNFKIWQSSIEAYSSSESEAPSTTFLATYHSWDGYDNPVVPNLDVEFDLRDRTADSSVDTYSTTTDSNGQAKWIWQGSLEQKEYEIRCWSYKNWFGDYYTAQGDSIDFSEGDTEGFIGYGAGGYDTVCAVNDTEKTLYVFDSLLTVAVIYSSQFVHPVNYLKQIMRVRAVSDTSWEWRFYDTLWTNASDLSDSLGISWVISEIDVSSISEADYTGTDYLRLQNVNTGTKLIIDYIKLVDDSWYSKSYFTPITAGYIDYWESETGNSRDWTENTRDGQNYYDGNDNVENGYYMHNSSDNYGFYFQDGQQSLTVDPDCNYYNILVVRAKADAEFTVNFYVRDSASNYRYKAITLTTSWQIYEWDIVNDYSESGSLDLTEVTRVYTYSSSYSINITYFDTVRLVHRDSSLASGHSWEFEETGYEENLDLFSNVDTTNSETKNGFYHLVVQGSGSYAYVGWSTLSIDSDDYEKIVIKVRANENGHNIRFDCNGGNWLGGTYSITTEWQVLTIGYSTDSDWSGMQSRFSFYYHTSLVAGDWMDVEFIRFYRESPPNLFETTTQFYTNSENNTLQYSVMLDDEYVGNFNDLNLIEKNLTVASHELFYFTKLDNDETNKVYLPSAAYYHAYTVSAAAFTVSVESFSLSDDYVNIYATANYDYSYTVYENDSSVGSGSGTAEGTAISHSKDSTYGALLNLAYKFVYSTETVWFNTSYSNAAYTQIIVSVSTPILVDGRVSIAVTTNLGGSEVHIEDDSKAGTEVDWESEGVFSWYSGFVGTNNITIQVRKDCNNDGDKTDTGETWSDTVQYHLYDADLEIVYAYLHTFTDEGASFLFMSNYRGSATTDFRARTQDELGWSGWLSEDTYNGTYDFTFVNCDLDTTYNFSVEIRAYITDESPGYQYKYLRFEYTPYSPDPIVSNPQGINRVEETLIPVDNKSEMFTFSVNGIQGILLTGIIIAVVVVAFVLYANREKIQQAPSIITEKSLDFAEKMGEDIEKRIEGNNRR
jgi:hypothetical protein